MNFLTKHLLTFFVVCHAIQLFSQDGMAINTTGAKADSSAILDISSKTQGVLIPRMTQTERDAISSPPEGLLIYQTNPETGFYYYTDASWQNIGEWQKSGGNSIAREFGNVNIGIDTNASDFRFRVHHSSFPRIALTHDEDSEAGIFEYYSANPNQLRIQYWDNWSKDTKKIEFMSFNFSREGRIGIHTTTPQAQFTLGGSPNSLDIDNYCVFQIGDDMTDSIGSKNFHWVNEFQDGTRGLNLYSGSWTHGVLRLSVTNDGNVGIGKRSPEYQLDVVGAIRAANVMGPSDINLKEGISTIQHPISQLVQLRGVEFQWRDKSISDSPQLGFIAQEVEKVFPEIVYTDSKGIKSMSYTSLIPVMLEGMKEQQEVIQKQDQMLRDQAEEIQQLRASLNKLIDKVNDIEKSSKRKETTKIR